VHQAKRSRCEKLPFRLTKRSALGMIMTPILIVPAALPDVPLPSPAGVFICGPAQSRAVPILPYQLRIIKSLKPLHSKGLRSRISDC